METLRYEIELQELITRREMMIAENKMREIKGDSLAYGEKAFSEIVSAFEYLQGRYLRQI